MRVTVKATADGVRGAFGLRITLHKTGHSDGAVIPSPKALRRSTWVVCAHVRFHVVKPQLPVPVYIDKREGLFPMRGCGRTGRRQVPSATRQVLFAEPALARAWRAAA
jgi:hypothetical protein